MEAGVKPWSPTFKGYKLVEEVIISHMHTHAHIYTGHAYQVSKADRTLQEKGRGLSSWEPRDCSMQEVTCQCGIAEKMDLACCSGREQHSKRKGPCEEGPGSDKIE